MNKHKELVIPDESKDDNAKEIKQFNPFFYFEK